MIPLPTLGYIFGGGLAGIMLIKMIFWYAYTEEEQTVTINGIMIGALIATFSYLFTIGVI